jgi:integrase
MARVSKGPRYYPSMNSWYATFNGQRIRLVSGPKKQTEQEAKERYQAEAEARKVQMPSDRNKAWWVLNQYVNYLENEVKNGELAQKTLETRRDRIKQFIEHFDTNTPVRDLKPLHLNEWAATMRQPRRHQTGGHQVKWNDRTADLGKTVIRGAFRWAAEEAGIISKNPFERKGKSRDKRVRSKPVDSQVAIGDDEHQLLLQQANRRSKKDFYYLLQFLYWTGARPAEMYLVTAAEWDGANQVFVIKANPQARGRYKLAHLGHDRTIFIPDNLVPLARELMARYPDGPLFRTERGKPYQKSSLCSRFKTIKRAANRAAGRAAVREEVRAYSYRHAFVTRWVKQDGPLAKLCALLDTSELMVHKHYSHLFQETETLRQSLNDFVRAGAGLPASAGSPASGVVAPLPQPELVPPLPSPGH